MVGNMLLGLSTRCFWAWGIENMKDLKIYIFQSTAMYNIFNSHRRIVTPASKHMILAFDSNEIPA
jgi:hypothetical protein